MVNGRPGVGSYLSGVSLFEGVAEEVRARSEAQAHRVTRGPGESFFKEGDASREFFVLIAGRVKLSQMSEDGQQVVLRVLAAGQAFGAAGAFGDPVYPVSVHAIEPATALAWDSPVMRRLFETEPRIAMNALEFVAGRLHDLQRLYRQLMTERVERRVARALLRLTREAGRGSGTGIEIDFPITRQDVAEMTGTTLYTVSRLISAWEKQGILRSGRQRIVVESPDALLSLAEDPQTPLDDLTTRIPLP
jgi:CRP-like cAMP-binding protein